MLPASKDMKCYLKRYTTDELCESIRSNSSYRSISNCALFSGIGTSLYQRNLSGRFHSWVMNNEDGKSRYWTRAYCGAGSHAVHMPNPSMSCSKNPAGRCHKLVMNN